MTAEQVRAMRNAHPFRPFTIHLADGRSFTISHRDFVFPASTTDQLPNSLPFLVRQNPSLGHRPCISYDGQQPFHKEQ